MIYSIFPEGMVSPSASSFMEKVNKSIVETTSQKQPFQ